MTTTFIPNRVEGIDFILENQINDWLYKYFGKEQVWPGLDRVLKTNGSLVQEFKSKNTKVVIIGGTNGKGEVSFLIDYLLREKKHKTALWISPHILSLTERFQINGKTIEQNKLFDLMKETKEKWDHLNLSYYEFLFTVFCHWAFEEQCTHLVLEVGLGGKQDAVNIFDADCSVITSISRDHQHILGTGYKKILTEKLGISRTQKTLLSCLELKFLRDFAKKYSNENKINYVDLFDYLSLEKNSTFQTRNQLLAYCAVTVLENNFHQLSVKELIDEVKKINFPKLPGRLEEWNFRGNSLVFAGSHNLDGVRKLSELLASNVSENNGIYDRVFLSFSMRPEEEIIGMVAILMKAKCYWKELSLTTFDHHRAVKDFSFLKKAKFKEECPVFYPDWKKEIENKTNQKFLFMGSYYFVGDVQRKLLSSI